MPLPVGDVSPRYDFANRLPRDNAQNIFVVLAFSGGGMRSAAFSYGVLETLRDTEILIDGVRRSLLDEVDVITSTSGGSYTAAYYGLFGEQIFEDFQDKFLSRSVRSAFTKLMLNPVNLLSLIKPTYNRGDLAARWLDRHLFENRRYAEMSLGELPFVIVNASYLNTGITFSFIQQQFDFLCSDINVYPVANAVMASSAIPPLFGPISVRNFDRGCVERTGSWVPDALAEGEILTREYQVARGLEQYLDPQHLPVVRLADGGITDNLGVRGSMMSPVAHYGNVPDMAGAFSEERLDAVTDVLVIIVNSQVYAQHAWSPRGRDPSLPAIILASFDAALSILNTETISLAERGFRAWADRVNEGRPAGVPQVDVQFAVLTFEHIADPTEREYFNSIPTSLTLSAEQVDRLRALARDLLDSSNEFRSFVESFR